MKYFLSSLLLLLLVIICLILLFLNNNLWPLKVREASSCYALKVSLSHLCVCVPEKERIKHSACSTCERREQKLFRFESTHSGFLLCAVLYICAIKAFVVTFNRNPFSFIFRLLLPRFVVCECVNTERAKLFLTSPSIHPPTHTQNIRP